MKDYGRRVKTIEKRLDMDGRENETIITPPPVINPLAIADRFPRLAGESDESYLFRYNNRPRDESKYLPPRTVTAGGLTIIMPRQLKPEFADLEN